MNQHIIINLLYIIDILLLTKTIVYSDSPSLNLTYFSVSGSHLRFHITFSYHVSLGCVLAVTVSPLDVTGCDFPHLDGSPNLGSVE